MRSWSEDSFSGETGATFAAALSLLSAVAGSAPPAAVENTAISPPKQAAATNFLRTCPVMSPLALWERGRG